jgi:hypothetical protein
MRWICRHGGTYAGHQLCDGIQGAFDGDGPGRLVGACLTDRQGDGLSMIYSFYDPEHATRTGLGNTIILDHIRRAARMACPMSIWAIGSRVGPDAVQGALSPAGTAGRDGWHRLPMESRTALSFHCKPHRAARTMPPAARMAARNVGAAADPRRPV